MVHESYLIKRYNGEFDTPTYKLSGVMIYSPDGKPMSVVQDAELAKRAITAHRKSGIWK